MSRHKTRFEATRSYCHIAGQFCLGPGYSFGGYVIASADHIYLIDSGGFEIPTSINGAARSTVTSLVRTLNPKDFRVPQIQCSDLPDDVVNHEDWPMRASYLTFDIERAVTFIVERQRVKRVIYPWWSDLKVFLNCGKRINIQPLLWQRGKLMRYLGTNGWLESVDSVKPVITEKGSL